MKKILTCLSLLMIIILPLNIKAELVDYNEGIVKSNNYILNNEFSNRGKYMLFDIPYEYNETGFVKNDDFFNGGMLSKREYESSVREEKSYLSPGVEYWTLSGSKSDASKRYYIDTALKEKLSTDASGIRVTEYLKNDVVMEGKGTYSDPFTFMESYLVRVGTNSIKYGKVYDIGVDDTKVSGEKIEKTAVLDGNDYVVDFNFKPLFGYKYVGNSGCGNLSKVGTTGNQYRISNITKDINCIINFNARIIKFKLVAGIDGLFTNPSLSEIYLRYNDKWYRDASVTTSITSITPPRKLGYEFLGYYYNNDTQAIKPNGQISLTSANLTKDVEEQEVVGKWRAKTYTVTYDGNGQTSGSMSPSTHYLEIKSKLTAVGYKKAGAKFLGWSRTKGATSAEFVDQAEILDLTGDGQNIVLYAVWSACEVGTYNDGSKITCTACPNGYTSAVGASAQTQCYITVPGGKTLTAKNGTGFTNCAAGTSKAQHNVNYGSADTACSNCAANQYAVAGSASCTPCPNGYVVASGAGKAQTSCYITVPAGKYLTSANGTGFTNCAAGKYKAQHNVNYGSSDSCTNCPANQWSTAGSSGCTGCPAGYVVASGAGTSQSSCYITVPAGQYLTAATGTATASCAAGKYKAQHNVNYGSGDSCTNCPANTYAGAGSSGCTACPSGYTVAEGAGTSSSSCKAPYVNCCHGLDACAGASNGADQCYYSCGQASSVAQCKSLYGCTYKTGAWCFRPAGGYLSCSQGDNIGGTCKIYNRTSCPSGWWVC